MAERGLCSINTLSQEKRAPSSPNIELFLIIEKTRISQAREMGVYSLMCISYLYISFSNSVVTKAEAACLGEVWEPSHVCQTPQAHGSTDAAMVQDASCTTPQQPLA